MDMLDRIAAVVRTLFGDAASSSRTGGSGPADPDLAAAWDELNDYLGAAPRRPSLPPESLRADYANLEVPFGADIETVRRSYKRLVLSYHPDRHADHPEKVRVATEITKKVNESFERIRSWQERTGASDR